MTNLPSILGPVLPIGQTAQYIREAELETYQHLEDFPERLSAVATMIIYIDPNDNVFHLNGPLAGREGVRIGENLQGEHQFPFEQVLIESSFQIGTTIQRTNLLKRLINARLVIGGPHMNNYTYRMCEDRWWAGQIETQPGWLGVFTRASGWRWTPIWPHKTVDTTLKQDPVAYGNNFAIWDVYWISELPYYSKAALWQKWDAKTSGPPDSSGFYNGQVVLANRGDLKTYVNYLVSGEGIVRVQDNNSDSMVQLPTIEPSDGAVLVSTEPDMLTLIAQHDPQDNEFYKLTRAAGILNFFLSGISSAGEPIWKRRYTRFVYEIPPRTVCHFSVQHSSPNGSVTAFVPQRYRRSR